MAECMATEEHDDKGLREVKAILRGLQRIGDRPPQAESGSESPGDAATHPENPAPHEESLRLPGRSREGAPSQAGNGSRAANTSADRHPAQGKHLAALALTMLAGGTVLVLAGDLFLKYWPGLPSGTPTASNGDAVGAPVATIKPAETIPVPVSPIETGQPVLQPGPGDDRAAPSAVTAAAANPAITNAHELMDSGRIMAAREMLRRPDLAATQEGAWLLARSYDPNYLATIRSPDAPADKQQAAEWYRRWRNIAARNGMVMDDLRLNRIINSMR